MSSVVLVLLLLAGLSESAGRILPMLARRRGGSRSHAILLLLSGAVVEGTAFALWPLTAWTLAGWVRPAPMPEVLTWTPGLLAP